MTVAALRPSRLPDLELRTPTSVDELAALVATGFRAYAGGSDLLLEAARRGTPTRLASTAAFPFSVPFNVSGHPAIVVPVGLVDGLPVAVQLVAAARQEALLLDVAEQLEEALALELWSRILPAGRT